MNRTDNISPDLVAGLSGDFDLMGKLGNFLISDLLQMVSLSGKTGTLALIQGWNTRTISFDRGRICYVAAGSRLAGMFDLLVRTGRLQRFQVDGFRARRPGKSDDELLSELVQRKILTREDLDRCNELLLENSVYTLFLWRNCVFTFKADEMNLEGGVPVTVDANHLIIEGTRRVDEWIEISPIVPSVLVIFRQHERVADRPVPENLRRVYELVDGQRDVSTIARITGLTQFEAARACYDLVKSQYVEAIPPNKARVCELFNLAIESIYMKLVLFDYSRDALLFETQLNRFAVSNKLKVRMASGKILRSDLDTPILVTELVDLYKLFIAIQNNKFNKTYEPNVAQGLMEGMYINSDPEMQAMMRMYEFIELEGLLDLGIFDRKKTTVVAADGPAPVLVTTAAAPVVATNGAAHPQGTGFGTNRLNGGTSKLRAVTGELRMVTDELRRPSF